MPDYRKFYSNYFPRLPEPNGQNEVMVSCPFHDDRDPSMSINLETGLWKCFGECDEGGDVYRFYEKIHDVDFQQAKRAVDEILSGKDHNSLLPIPEELIQKWHDALLNAPEILNFLIHSRGSKTETLVKYKIGWDGQRITIPIYDEHGLCVNVRRYSPKSKGQNKMLNYKAGYGKARLFPISNLKGKSILICEGEMDCLLANQLGFNAITTTGGAGTWLSAWNELFKGKIVYICYDIDQKGKKGATRVAELLHPYAQKVYVVDLPLQEPDNADITDYFIKHGYTLDDFKVLLKRTKPYVPVKDRQAKEKPSQDEVHEVSLFEARLAKYRDRKVRMSVLVVGKDLAPYTIPRKIKFSCSAMTPEDKKCMTCSINNNGGEVIMNLTPNPNLLKLIRCSDQQQKGYLRQWAGIPKCSMYSEQILEPQNIEELLLAPEVTYNLGDKAGDQYTLQRAFFAAGGSGSLAPNQSYLVEGVMAPDPWQQYATFLLTDAKPLQDSVSAFKLTDDIKEKLKIFQVAEGQTVKEKFDEIHEQFAHNVTHIYGRNDLLTAFDLVYHSVLQFYFQNTLVKKGWLECLVIGDTRTGKSESAEQLLRHYKLGEMVFGENTSFAGLVGGMQQTQSRWFITWGKIPLNDRRLIIIDEASGLYEEDIARMSGIRSSGIAEITKIQTERALARTRLIWLSNPRSGKALRTYSYGVEAIPELIGKAEDVARFDFAVSSASEEVPAELINKIATDDVPQLTYTSDVCKALILWAWSRKPEDVVFEKDAVKAILKYAIEMGKTYSTKIPLVESANQRIKLARMAVAAAARVFSTDDRGDKVIVRKEHVDFVYDYLDQIYSKPSLDYKSFSHQEKEAERIAQEKADEVFKFIEAFPDVADIFLRQTYVRAKDIEEQLDLDKPTVKEHIHFLSRARMIDRTTNGYRKSPAFISLLRKWKSKGMD